MHDTLPSGKTIYGYCMFVFIYVVYIFLAMDFGWDQLQIFTLVLFFMINPHNDFKYRSWDNSDSIMEKYLTKERKWETLDSDRSDQRAHSYFMSS